MRDKILILVSYKGSHISTQIVLSIKQHAISYRHSERLDSKKGGQRTILHRIYLSTVLNKLKMKLINTVEFMTICYSWKPCEILGSPSRGDADSSVLGWHRVDWYVIGTLRNKHAVSNSRIRTVRLQGLNKSNKSEHILQIAAANYSERPVRI